MFILVYPDDADFTPPLLLTFIIKHLEAAGVEVINIVYTLPEPYYLMGMVVMYSRYGPEDTYVMLSDVDMWPLSKETFERETSTLHAVDIFD